MKQRIKVDDKFIREIPFYNPTPVLDTHTGMAVTVTLLRANHCPGAAMMLFSLPSDGPLHLHTGDFRFHTKFKLDPVLSVLSRHGRAQGGRGGLECGNTDVGKSKALVPAGVCESGCQSESESGTVGNSSEDQMREERAGGGAAGMMAAEAETGALIWAQIFTKGVDTLFLDTTYCAPQHTFPLQSDAVDFVADLVKANRFANPHTLFLFGTYTIGKEEVFLAAARAISSKVYVHPAKKRVLDCLEWPEADKKLLTTSASESDLHVVPMSCINFKHMATCLSMSKGRRAGGYKTIVGIRPTGWTFSGGAQGRGGRLGAGSTGPTGPAGGRVGGGVEKALGVSRQEKGPLVIYGVPYSEHSSFSELREMVKLVGARQVVPTVNGGNPQRVREMLQLLSG